MVPVAAEGGSTRGRLARSSVIVLLLNGLLMALVAWLLLALLRSQPVASPAGPVSSLGRAGAAQPPRTQTAQPHERPTRQPEPVSWALAEGAYRGRDYALAQVRYERLLARSQATPANAVVSDFFRFRSARCLARSGKLKRARALLGDVCQSDSPAVRAAAHYDLAVLEYLSGNHLSARVQAYAAVAAIRAIRDASPLEADADYLAARALTDKVLAFHGTALAVPLSSQCQEADIFAGLQEPALRKLLSEGLGTADRAILAPQIERIPGRRTISRYSARCLQAPLEELLHHLSLKAGTKIQWAKVDPPARRRAVTLVVNAGSAQRVCEVACGMTGLVARFAGEQTIIYNPHSCKSLSEQRKLLYDEAVSVWRRFLLRWAGERRLPHCHFAVACLHEWFADTLSAMREYHLVAARFPKDEVAGLALLRGADLRIRLRDYSGARSDLTDLLNLYPDCKFLDRVYLRLGQASMNAGLLDKAIHDFRKLYYLDLSLVSRKKACLGAARCFQEKGEHGRARQWLQRYFKVSGGRAGDEVAEAYLLLSRSLAAEGDLAEAARALYCALGAEPSGGQRLKTLLELAALQKRRSRFVKAVSTLRQIEPASLTSRQKCDYLLTTAGVYRAMGFGNKAVAVLRREIPSISDEKMALAMRLEMARCHAEAGNLTSARGLLAELLPEMAPGPEANRAACELAEMCLAEGKTAQAIAIGRELLRSGGPDMRRRMLELLGEAYFQQQDYERAALAFSGVMGGQPGGSGK